MQTLKRNYDRALALFIAVVTLAVSTTLVVKSFAIGEKFSVEEPVVKPSDFRIGADVPVGLAAHLEADHLWAPPQSGEVGKLSRAFASTPVYWVDGELVEGYDGPPIRGDVPNAWLLKHRLPIERDNVLQLDPDRDGFSNVEEYEHGGTDPNDASSHPDVLLKLELSDVTKEDFVMVFAGQAGKEVNLRKIGGWKGWFESGAMLPGGRHRLVEMGDGKAVTLLEVATGEKVFLERKVKTDLPIYRAVFSYAIDESLFRGKSYLRGDRFAISKEGLHCIVTQVRVDSVELGVRRPGGSREAMTLKR